MGNMKVCAYCRVSTDSTDQLNSFENQKKYFTEVINKNPNWELKNIYADKGITGTSLIKRPQFNQMLIDAGLDIKEQYNNKNDKRNKNKAYIYFESERQPQFNLILVKNTSRFARNIMSIDIITKLRNKGVYIFFVEINKSTENLSDDFLIELFSLLDEEESKEKSRRVRFGQERSAETGIINVNSKIYGYEFIKGIRPINNTLKIIPKEANIIKKIFELYANEYGIRRILNYLNENKIKTRSGKEFCKSSISRILSNEKYAGILVRNKYDTGIVLNNKHYPTIKDEQEWKVFENRIPPIISVELFKKCQDIRSNKMNKYNQKGIYKGISEYAGLIKCGKCKSVYTSNISYGTKFYNCSLKKRKGIKFCNNPNVSKKMIDEKIEELCNGGYYKQFETIRDYTIFILKDYKKLLLNRIDQDLSDQVKAKKNELEKLTEGLNRIIDLYQNLNITKEQYLDRTENLKEKIDVLKIEICQMDKGNEDLYTDINNIDKSIKDIKNIEIKHYYNKEEFLNQVDCIEVTKKKKIKNNNKSMDSNKIKKMIENAPETKQPNLNFIYKWMTTFRDIVYRYGKNEAIMSYYEKNK